MTKKEFLEIFNDIDDEFLNELANGELPGNRFGGVFLIDELGGTKAPQIIRLTKARVSFWKYRLTAAAAICVITIGAFTLAKLNRPQDVSPNSSGISDSGGVIYSEVYSDLPILNDKLKMTEIIGTDFAATLKGISFLCTDEREKTDSENYAAVCLICRNVSKRNPLKITICKGYNTERYEQVGEDLYIYSDGAHNLKIKYKEPAETGEIFFIQLQRATILGSEDSTYDIGVSGKFLP